VEGRTIVDAARLDDSVRALVTSQGELLGDGAALLADLLDPDLIILGGIVADSTIVLRSVQQRVMAKMGRWVVDGTAPLVVSSSFRDRAALLGAALHARACIRV
jgi:predicted NBD/HSP70 family sugar kinase